MRLNFRNASLARVKATYERFFGHSVPFSDAQAYDVDTLTKRLDRAVRDMKPLPELTVRNSNGSQASLSTRALMRWRYMNPHRRQ